MCLPYIVCTTVGQTSATPCLLQQASLPNKAENQCLMIACNLCMQMQPANKNPVTCHTVAPLASAVASTTGQCRSFRTMDICSDITFGCELHIDGKAKPLLCSVASQTKHKQTMHQDPTGFVQWTRTLVAACLRHFEVRLSRHWSVSCTGNGILLFTKHPQVQSQLQAQHWQQHAS